MQEMAFKAIIQTTDSPFLFLLFSLLLYQEEEASKDTQRDRYDMRSERQERKPFVYSIIRENDSPANSES